VVRCHRGGRSATLHVSTLDVSPTVADANGMFTIDIPLLTGSDAQMVLMEAQGAGNQTHVTFTNLLDWLRIPTMRIPTSSLISRMRSLQRRRICLSRVEMAART
jgi:hypothetical protein